MRAVTDNGKVLGATFMLAATAHRVPSLKRPAWVPRARGIAESYRPLLPSETSFLNSCLGVNNVYAWSIVATLRRTADFSATAEYRG